jgi:hypothetical protein
LLASPIHVAGVVLVVMLRTARAQQSNKKAYAACCNTEQLGSDLNLYLAKASVTGTRTLVSRVRAVCPDHLDSNGS